MRSPIVKRSIVIAGHRTSVSLEDAFWSGLREIADQQHMTLSELAAAINAGRQHSNRSSALRLFVLDFYRDQVAARERRGNMRDQVTNATGPIVGERR
jgi:predicted DNA-binding ribbon-helix-helix protein